MPFETLEEAQAEIVRLNEELIQKGMEYDSLLENNNAQAKDIETLRTINQQYFNRLMVQDSQQAGKKPEDDEEALTCEEFARTLKI